MLNLSSTEYLPVLAEGYHWSWNLDNNSDSIYIRIVFIGILGDRAEVKRRWVPLEEGITDDTIRDRVLKEASEMMGTYRPWNPVGADQVKRVMASLETPKDFEYPVDEF